MKSRKLASFVFQCLYAQSPSDVKQLLKIVLTSKGKLHGQDIAPRFASVQCCSCDSMCQTESYKFTPFPSVCCRTPLQNRQLDGAVHRVPPGFYDKGVPEFSGIVLYVTLYTNNFFVHPQSQTKKTEVGTRNKFSPPPLAMLIIGRFFPFCGRNVTFSNID